MNLPEHSYYKNAELISDYKNLLVDFVRIFSPGQAEDEYLLRAENLIRLKLEFVSVYAEPEQERSLMYKKSEESLASFQSKYPNLPMGDLMKDVPQNLMIANQLGMV